jgi:hypothetical protein
MAMKGERTLYDEFIGDRFVYPLGEDGQPDYGFVSMGGREYRVVGVRVINIGGSLHESLELDNGMFLPGREMSLDS